MDQSQEARGVQAARLELVKSSGSALLTKMILIAVLSKTLECWLVPSIQGDIVINSTEYRDSGQGDWTGFYDFLRTAQKTIIGIRYSPLADDGDLLTSLTEKPYATVLSNGTFELYLSGERAFVPELSADQSFGDNVVLRSSSGEHALTFGLDDLEMSERSQLENSIPRL